MRVTLEGDTGYILRVGDELVDRVFAHWLDAWDGAKGLVRLTDKPVRILRVTESLLLDSLEEPRREHLRG